MKENIGQASNLDARIVTKKKAQFKKIAKNTNLQREQNLVIKYSSSCWNSIMRNMEWL